MSGHDQVTKLREKWRWLMSDLTYAVGSGSVVRVYDPDPQLPVHRELFDEADVTQELVYLFGIAPACMIDECRTKAAGARFEACVQGFERGRDAVRWLRARGLTLEEVATVCTLKTPDFEYKAPTLGLLCLPDACNVKVYCHARRYQDHDAATETMRRGVSVSVEALDGTVWDVEVNKIRDFTCKEVESALWSISPDLRRASFSVTFGATARSVLDAIVFDEHLFLMYASAAVDN